MCIVGSRGVGKTFNVISWCIHKYLTEHKRFFIVRRTVDEIRNNHKKILEPMFLETELNPWLEGHKFRVKDKQYQIQRPNSDHWEVMGDYCALKHAHQLKGSAFPHTYHMVYDEFLWEKGSTAKELKNEPEILLGLCETVFRTRIDEARIFLLSNATTFESTYKYEWGLSLPQNGSRYWYHKTKPIVVEYVPKGEYEELKEQSAIGLMGAGTNYNLKNINNEFVDDSTSYIKKKKGNYRLGITFSYNKKYYGIYQNVSKRRSKQLIVDKLKKKPERLDFTIKGDDMDECASNIFRKSNYLARIISAYFNDNKLCYQSMEVKTHLHELFMKIL